MTKQILLCLILTLGACSAPSDVSLSPDAAPAALVCVTNYTRCQLSADPYQNEGCWELRTCNRAPLPAETTMACQAVASASTLGRYFCTWSDT